LCMAALGSQTGGSIIRPASYCGVAGIKPKFGSVPSDGVVPVSASLDHVGPIARHVDDLSVVLSAIQDKSPAETKDDAAIQPPEAQFAIFDRYFFEQADPAVQRITQKAIDRLKSAGVEIETIKLPNSFDKVHQMHWRIMAAHAAEYHREQFETRPEDFGPNVSRLIEEGLRTTTDELNAALNHQQEFKNELAKILTENTVAITPATVTTAPATLETTGDPRFNSPWSYSGHPAVSFPCGLDENGMPSSLQLVSAMDNFELLKAASWCEQQVDFDARPHLNE